MSASPSSSWKLQFASDNCAPASPEAMQAIQSANDNFLLSYGDDDLTRQARELIKNVFAPLDPIVGFVFNGTAANCLALRAMCRPYHGIICHQSSHLETDECGAPAFFTGGSKLIKVPGPQAKITADQLRATALRRNDVHFPMVKAVSISMSTEWGTLYTMEELKAIGAVARELGLHVHLDGARFANAVAGLGVKPSEIIEAAAVDILSFGGTKNGSTLTEAVVFFDRTLGEDFDFLRKQSAQLASKMRFLTAPWLGLLQNDRWLDYARHANSMARRLADGIGRIDGLEIKFPVDANAVFFTYPAKAYEWMEQEGWHFYEFVEIGAYRAMCNWSTTPDQVDAFVAALAEGLKQHG
jgi:threonine aldolase